MDLRVVSLNVWGIPSPVGRHVDERMELIAARLPDFDAHVVVLQEVWTEASRETLLAGGLAAGYRHVWHLPTARGGSGLVALSRLPIEDVRFTPYFLCGLPQRFDHMDFYSGKGFVRLDIRFEDRPVAIFATHLIARYAPKDVADRYRGHRAAQVLQLADAVGKIDGPIIAVGDFNFTESSPEYAFFAGLTGLEDAAVALDARQNTSTLENAYRRARGAVGKSRIDYAFVRSGVKEGARATHVQTVFDEPLTIDGEPAAYSDHTGLLVDVRLGGNGRAVPVPTPEALQIARELLDEGRARMRSRRNVERGLAGASALAGGALLAFACRPRATRRAFLRGALFTGAALAWSSTAGLATLSEVFVPEERRGYERADALLARISLLILRKNERKHVEEGSFMLCRSLVAQRFRPITALRGVQTSIG